MATMRLRDRLRHWLLRFTAKQIPALGKLLNLANGTVDRLSEEVMHYRDRERLHFDDAAAYCNELREAISIATDHWAAPLRESAGVPTSKCPAVIGLHEAIESTKTKLRETIYGMAELELAIEDRGWKRMIAQSQFEFSRFGL